MKSKIIWIVIAIVAAALLLWWLGWAGAALLGTLGLGGAGKALAEYAGTQRDQEKDRATAEEHKHQQLAEVSREAKVAAEHQAAKKKIDEAAAKQAVKRAETKADLDAAVDKEAAALDAFLDREDGRIGVLVLAILAGALVIALLLALATVAHSAPPTSAEKARAAKIIRVLKRAKRVILKLKSDHALQIKRLMIQHQAATQKAAANLRACQAQKQIIAKHLNPPMWPWLLLGIAVGGAAAGGAWGVVAIVQGVKR